MTTSFPPVIVEQLFDVSKLELWNAITQLDEMKLWYFDNLPDFKPVEGFTTRFVVRSDERCFTHIWKITEVVPLRKISYQWTFEEYSGTGLVSFELFDSGKETLLRLTNEGLESFPNDVPEFKRESCEAGWNYFIRQNLHAYMKNKE